ncbi:hypothetical protein D3C72_1180920 [compost metagenome]
MAALRAGRLWGLDPHHAGGPPHRALPQERARQAAPDGAGAATGVALRQAHPAHRLPQPGPLWRQPGGGAGGEFRLSGQERGQADPRRGGAAGGAAPGPQPLPAGQAPRACPRRPRQGDAAAGGAGRLARGGVAGGAYRACAGPRSLHAYGGAAVCPAGGWQPAGGPSAHHHRRGSAALAGGPGGELYPPLPRADLGRLASGGQQHNGGARLRGQCRVWQSAPPRLPRHGAGDPLPGIHPQAFHLRSGPGRGAGALGLPALRCPEIGFRL